MANIPKTSISLISALADNTAHAQWHEFHNAYEATMRDFMASRYPMLEADDVIQETMISIFKRLPNYDYSPERHGHFHNYLIGILKHKALDAMRRHYKKASLEEPIDDEPPAPSDKLPMQDEDETWRHSAMEVAIDQLMADDSLSPNTRMIFEHVVLLHEPPESVAAKFGTTRNNVDQIKARLLAKLRKIVETITKGE